MSTAPLTAQHALDTLSRHAKMNPSRFGELILHVQTYNPGSVGGTPGVGVIRAQAGNDWDHGRFLLQPERPLTILTPGDVEAIHASSKQAQSWHTYQIVKKYTDRIKELEAELRALKGGA
jgi:hypothetical protein